MRMFVFIINTGTLISNSDADRVENFLEFEYRVFQMQCC